MSTQAEFDFNARRQAASEDVLRKIRALLALATSPNEHEAALALQRANGLMARYNLDMSEVKGGRVQPPTAVGHDKFCVAGTVRRFHQILLKACGEACFCDSFTSRETDFKPGKGYYRIPYKTWLYLVGTETNRTVAKLQFQWLLAQVARLSLAELEYCPYRDKKRQKKWRVQFCLGMAVKISERLQPTLQIEGEAPVPSEDQLPGLIRLHQDANSEYCEQQGWKLNKVKAKKRPRGTGLAAGYMRGGEVNLKPARALEA